MTRDVGDGVEVKSRRLVAENTKFNVFFEHIIDRVSGDDVPNFLIVEPKTRSEDLVTGVAILPILNGQVGLVRIYRPPVKAWCYEIPHGFTESNESEEAAARRELLEEAGLQVNCMEDLGIVMPDSGIVAAHVRMFAALVSDTLVGQTLETGLREFKWVPIPDFEEMLKKSEIQDSYTLSAWCRYLIKRKG